MRPLPLLGPVLLWLWTLTTFLNPLPASAAPYASNWTDYNLNTNEESGSTVTSYSGSWDDHDYYPSPTNWRQHPVYTLIIDRWLDGSPERNDQMGTMYEWDHDANQLRHGGDIQGLLSGNFRSLDYLQSMGYGAIYLAGTPFINLPWGSDGYSPLDFTILDPHFGTLEDWRTFVTEVHRRGMYIIVDFTVGTMSDLVGFKGYLNTSTPFDLNEHDATWKQVEFGPIKQYPDFTWSNTKNDSCVLPQFWQEDGTRVTDGPALHTGCYESEFDHYGDTEAFGSHPDWQRELSKFASVQDRLREWNPDVRAKLEVFGCLIISMLDIDGIRIDKATQMTVDALAEWASTTRTCASNLGKKNFFIPGEITGGNNFGSIYLGRGRTPDQVPNATMAPILTADEGAYFLRDEGKQALDSAAFHYSIYRSLTRTLGMDGNISVGWDVDTDFVNAWYTMLTTNDFLNPATGDFDPRHLYGVVNQDVFRWPSITNGTRKGLFGTFITTLLLPGIPLTYYGEEQALYEYDSQAANYLFGRQPMGSNVAWQKHGCYMLGVEQYNDMPFDKSKNGCNDDWNSLDHLDPTSAGRNIMARMFQLRREYPALLDGFSLSSLAKWTTTGTFPGSNGTATEFGVWSVSRQGLQTQSFSGAQANTSVWLVYSNMNDSMTIEEDCSSTSFINTPYQANQSIQNLFYPYDKIALSASKTSYYLDKKAPWRGCVPSFTLEPHGFAAYVPATDWIAPPPVLTGFLPGHDARLVRGDANGTNIDLTFQYSTAMSCDSISDALTITSERSNSTSSPSLDLKSVVCGASTETSRLNADLNGAPPTAWSWSGTIVDADDGIYMFSLTNVTSAKNVSTGTTDNLLVRKGLESNIMIFPASTEANYVDELLTAENGKYYLNHAALGASSFRWSSDFGQHWSQWADWESRTELSASDFNKTSQWVGKHIQVQYHSELAASAAHLVESDLDYTGGARRIPSYLLRGEFNDWGFDNGLPHAFKIASNESWDLKIMMTWPTYLHIQPFKDITTFFYGDVDQDGILDRLQPTSQATNYINITAPAYPHLGYTLSINAVTRQWFVHPRGSAVVSMALFLILALVPIIMASVAVIIYRKSFYRVTYNQIGVKAPRALPLWFQSLTAKSKNSSRNSRYSDFFAHDVVMVERPPGSAAGEGVWPDDPTARRKVLIATLEYELIGIQPPIKVKIGGLGVMSSLMGKAMTDVQLVWVVPKVKDIEYPPFTPTDPIIVKIFDKEYPVEVEKYEIDNITYYILDSPVFRAQTKSDPYPARMDDLESAIFYSHWNQCVAEVIRRTPNLSIYHINDYHATIAPLYLLPQIIPVCLSLHNAEFQGLWPLTTEEEKAEVSNVFHLSPEIIEKYVQFGTTFNLLHAGAAIVAIHQASTGVAGVSDKYGKRSWARYPALWTLKKIDSLPNPDPTDVDALDEKPRRAKSIKVNHDSEEKRPEYRRQAQAWAGLHEDPSAELFVFVGRWSKQKGVDLIADIFPSILDKNPKVQLICVGPVVDLYGRFAAEKLARLMKLFPGRTALPPFLFQGAEFALIPSRDEPFGLVAVEFGRKGALGVGSRLGGLGLAPGWWFNVESDSTAHMLSQFGKTIKAALKSTRKEREVLRARSAVQRFPVLEWRQRTEDLHRRSILASRKHAKSNAFHWDDFRHEDAPPLIHSYPPRADQAPRSPGLTPMASPNPSYLEFGLATSRTPPDTPGDSSPHMPLLDLPGPRVVPHSRHPLQTGFANDDSDSSDDEVVADSDPDDDDETPRPDTPTSRTSRAKTSSNVGSFLERANTRLERQLTRSDASRTADPLFQSGTDLEAVTEDSNQSTLRAGRPRNRRSRSSVERPTVGALLNVDDEPLEAPDRQFGSRPISTGSISSLMDEKSQSPLNVALASFTDADGLVTREFMAKMSELSPSNSMKDDFCIETYLIKQEKVFFDHIREEKRNSAKAASRQSFPLYDSSTHSSTLELDYSRGSSPLFGEWSNASGLIRRVPTRLQIWMLKEIGGWPIYCIVLAIGQMLGASSFQLVLIGGSSTQSNTDLYIIGGVYLFATLVWYSLYTFFPLRYTLSLPFLGYAIAFLIVGLPSAVPILKPWTIRHAMSLSATCLYAFASAAGWAYFSFNFGEEGGVQTSSWVYRACVVQGTQQIWLAALWFWGFKLSGRNSAATVPSIWILCATVPLAFICLALAYVTLFGLPGFYRQVPGHITNFVATLVRRKLVLWFLFAQVLSIYWLSPPYGRNWQFLWQTGQVPIWGILVLVVAFFIGVWGVLLAYLSYMSREHTWFLPIFAVGLGAPRWCQMLWGTSSIGVYLPWAGVAGPWISISLWLWLGVLDSIQGVGLGMMLLQTLSRVHVGAALAAAQVVGSVVTIVARATSPDNNGPGSVFPNFGLWNPSDHLSDTPFAKWAFWVALGCQFVILFGYLVLFRGEQLSKP